MVCCFESRTLSVAEMDLELLSWLRLALNSGLIFICSAGIISRCVVLKASPLKASLTAGSSGVCRVPWGFSRRGGPLARKSPEQPGKISGPWRVQILFLESVFHTGLAVEFRVVPGLFSYLVYSVMTAQMIPACRKRGDFRVNSQSLCSPTLLHPGVGSRWTRSSMNNLELL